MRIGLPWPILCLVAGCASVVPDKAPSDSNARSRSSFEKQIGADIKALGNEAPKWFDLLMATDVLTGTVAYGDEVLEGEDRPVDIQLCNAYSLLRDAEVPTATVSVYRIRELRSPEDRCLGAILVPKLREARGIECLVFVLDMLAIDSHGLCSVITRRFATASLDAFLRLRRASAVAVAEVAAHPSSMVAELMAGLEGPEGDRSRVQAVLEKLIAMGPEELPGLVDAMLHRIRFPTKDATIHVDYVKVGATYRNPKTQFDLLQVAAESITRLGDRGTSGSEARLNYLRAIACAAISHASCHPSTTPAATVPSGSRRAEVAGAGR